MHTQNVIPLCLESVLNSALTTECTVNYNCRLYAYLLQKLECPNCCSRDPRLKLARLLERAWVRSVNTRLAQPFLRPLLPLATALSASVSCSPPAVSDSFYAPNIISSVKPILNSSGTAESRTEYFSSPELPVRSKKRKGPAGRTLELGAALTNSNGHVSSSESCEDGSNGATAECTSSDTTLQSAKDAWLAVMQATKPVHAKRTKTDNDKAEEDNKPIDLIGVLEKIHHAQYTTVREYYSDLNHIRNMLKTKIEGHYCDIEAGEKVTYEITSRHSLVLAFDTVIDSSYTFLSDKLLRISELEQRMRDHGTDPTADDADAFAAHGAPTDSSADTGTRAGSGQQSPQDVPRAGVPLNGAPDSPSKAVDATMAMSDGASLVPSASALATAPPAETALAVRTRRSLQASTAEVVNKPVTTATPQVTALMKSLWRVECTHLVPSTVVLKALNSQAFSTVVDAATIDFHISPRSLPCWTAYIEQGRFPSEHRGTSDPYSMRSTIAANEVLHSEKGLMQSKAREMLYGCGDPQFAKYMVNISMLLPLKSWFRGCARFALLLQRLCDGQFLFIFCIFLISIIYHEWCCRRAKWRQRR